MVSRALLYRHAASVSRAFTKPVHYFHKPVHSSHIGCRWSTAVAVVTGSDGRFCSVARYNSPVEPNGRLLRRSKRNAIGAAEHRIWSCIQNGSIRSAVALSHNALEKKNSKGKIVLSPLAYFVLSKRLFHLDCLFAGVHVALCHIDPSLALDSKELMMVFAAFLSETSADMLDQYCSLSDKQLEVVDTILLASVTFHYLQNGHYRRARALSRRISQSSWYLIEACLANPLNAHKHIPKSIDQAIRAAWMLRHPDSDSVDVSVACTLVTSLIRLEIVPDRSVLEKLISFSMGQKKLRAAMPIYASRWHSTGFSKTATIRLAAARTLLAQHSPRVHYDMLGSLARADDLEGALTLTIAIGCRRMFHLLLSLWSSRQPGDWKGMARIVQTMIDTLDCKFLHSTQSLAIKSMLDATKQPDNAGFVNEILNSTLNLHWPLLLRLESLSIAALHQLMHAFIDNRMLHTAFQIYRHAEKHIEPAQLKRLFATDALFAVLAKGLAQRGDVRSIMHLANVVTQRGIRMTLHFYTSLICGLLHGIKLRRLTYRHGRGQYAAFILERVQMAESVLEIVSRNNIYCPPKVYHAIMYGWALLGCPKMARRYFDKVSSLKLPSSRSNRSRSGASQTTWGILMYSYVCARDARGAIHVLDKAKKWMQESSASKSPLATMDDSDSDIHKTNHLINMAMAVLIGRRDAAGALELLDSYIERYASSQNMPDNSQTSQELLATPADPITLNLILRALLLSNQLQHAVTVYDTVHSEFKLLESPDALRPLLRYYFKKNDLNGVSLVTKRMFNLGGIPTLKELFYMVRLSVYEQDTALVLYLYDKMGIATASGTESKFVYFLKCKPEMVPLIYWALTANGRDADALDIESTFGEIVPNTSSGLLPSTPTQRRTAAVKEVHKRPIALYRDLLREINDFPLVELRRKLRYNVRFVFELYRDLKPNSPLVCRLLEDGNQQKKWLRSWHNDPEGCQLATYNSPALPDPTEPDKGSK